ncbi:MAG: hypothetical protein DCF19_18030 [Pseudanabaena frigida]|uniref:Response regulatory domain-containing protein n=1 Tax=Pseudanabaena frigida TaxID=945775 RepID=A0A2W4VY09_9CYAN|nr:MAG: hypothetical protein DCF19_18030 [Pseudanabaena frigida]
MRSQKKIVLIDKDHHICNVVKMCVEVFSNWQVTTARSVEEGLATSVKVRPDAILLDMLMLRKDGFDVLEKLRADSELVDIPVVLLTTPIELTESQNIVRLRVQGAISKPFYSTKLASQISQILGW